MKMLGFKFMNDKTLIQLIRMGNEEALSILYSHTFPTLKKYVLQNRGKMSDARETTVDSLLYAWQTIIRNRLVPGVSLKPYILAIGRNKWNKRQRQDRKKKKNSPEPAQPLIAPGVFTESWQLLSDHERKLLGQFYFDGFNLKDLADNNGMNGAEQAKREKHLAFRKLALEIEKRLSATK